MAIRRVFCLSVLTIGLFGGNSSAWSQAGLAQTVPIPSGLLNRYESTEVRDSSKEMLANLPADYFSEEETTTSTEAAQTRAASEDEMRGRRWGNLIVLTGLALSFSVGLVITVTTIRRQSAGAAPRPLF